MTWSAEPAAESRQDDWTVSAMSEHDLLEVVEIEESCGLSLWGWEAYQTELTREDAVMLVARRARRRESSEGRSLSGFIAARVAAGEMHINNVGVLEPFRGHGIGSSLLGEALAEAARRGGRTALLEVRAGNTAAQALYRRHGFGVAGRRQNYYREPTEDALVMSARLR